MEAERLQLVLTTVREELDNRKIQSLVAEVGASLSSSATQASTAATEKFETELASLYAVLGACPSNDLVPSLARIMRETGAERVTGIGLARRMREQLAMNQITPAKAVEAISTLAAEIATFQAAAKSVTNGLSKLNVSADQLEATEHELGVAIPGAFIGPNLEGLAKELKSLDRHVKAFAEVTDADTASCKLRSIGTGCFEVFAVAPSATAAAIAFAIERIVVLYKSMLEIRVLRKQLVEKQAPAEALRLLEEDERKRVTRDLDTVRDEILSTYAGETKPDKARRNELKVALGQALHYLAERIDRGFDFEIRTAPVVEQEPAAEPSGEISAAAAEERRLSNVVQQGRALRGLERVSEPVLCLPAPPEPVDNGDAKKKQ